MFNPQAAVEMTIISFWTHYCFYCLVNERRIFFPSLIFIAFWTQKTGTIFQNNNNCTQFEWFLHLEIGFNFPMKVASCLTLFMLLWHLRIIVSKSRLYTPPTSCLTHFGDYFFDHQQWMKANLARFPNILKKSPEGKHVVVVNLCQENRNDKFQLGHATRIKMLLYQRCNKDFLRHILSKNSIRTAGINQFCVCSRRVQECMRWAQQPKRVSSQIKI